MTLISYDLPWGDGGKWSASANKAPEELLPHPQKGDVFVNLIVIVILQYIGIPNHIAHLKGAETLSIIPQ